MDSNNCCISRDTRVSDMRITAAVTFKNQICVNIYITICTYYCWMLITITWTFDPFSGNHFIYYLSSLLVVEKESFSLIMKVLSIELMESLHLVSCVSIASRSSSFALLLVPRVTALDLRERRRGNTPYLK